ncbi:MAG: NlpC/P60 family protein [Bosea sp. (in: a-proteobacteria)]
MSAQADFRAQIIAAAHGWIGTPYRHQASLRGAGCDCLGLLRGVWREVIGEEPVTIPAYPANWVGQASGQARDERLLEAARAVLVLIPLADAQAGDVLLFRWKPHLPAMHCAILVGPDAIIHAYEGAVVSQTSFAGPWARRVSHAFAFPFPDHSRSD